MDKQWLPDELDYNIKHFNELFIENLSQSLSTVLVKKSSTVNYKDEKKLDNIEDKPYSEEEEQQSSSDEELEENDIQDS